MIPEKNKTYAIACLGPYEYNKYAGIGEFTGETDDRVMTEDPYIYYQFNIPTEKEPCWFNETEIIAEIK